MKSTENYTSKVLNLTPHELDYREKTWLQILQQLEKYLELPNDDLLALKKQCFIEIDQLIEIARSAGKSPFALEQERVEEQNKEIRRIRDIENNGFIIGLEEFKKYIAPIIKKVEFFPDLAGKTFLGNSILEKIYQSTSSEYYESSEAAGELLGFCDASAVQGFSKILKKNLEIIFRSRALNYDSVKAIGHQNICNVCTKLDGYLPVESLWIAYTLNAPLFPHAIPSDDEAIWCPGPTLLIAPNDPFGLR